VLREQAIRASGIAQVCRLAEEVSKPKYELISSHTGRRSFCTNKFLQKIPVKAIMAISGHATEKAFMKYLKLGNEEIVRAYAAELITTKSYSIPDQKIQQEKFTY
jgi:integrase